MHETFCFWSLSQWAAAAKDVASAWRVISCVCQSLLIGNRYRGKAELFQMVSGELLRWNTRDNMLLIADKQ